MAENHNNIHRDTAEGSATSRQHMVPRWAGIGIFLLLAVFALAYAQLFFVPVVLAFLLSTVFSPVRRIFDRLGFPQGLTALGIVGSLLIILAVITTALAMPVNGWINNSAQIEYKIEARFHEISGPFSGFFRAKEKLEKIAGSGSDEVQKVETQGTSITERLASLGPVYLGQSVFTLVLLIFLLASGDMFYEKIVHTLPNLRDKRRAGQMARAIERQLSRYLLTITVINAGLGIAVGLAMWGLGMPSPLIFGIIAFLFNFVPYLGAIIGVAIAATVALVTFNWLAMPLIVGGVYLALTTIEGQFVTPYFIGRSLRLNSVVVFLAISFWAWLWSAVGMIVAVPLLVAVKTVCDHIGTLEPLGNFLAERYAENDSDPVRE